MTRTHRFLESRLKVYGERYRKRPRLTAIKLACACIKSLFMKEPVRVRAPVPEPAVPDAVAQAAVRPNGEPFESWLTVIDREGHDITPQFRETVNAGRMPKLDCDDTVYFHIDPILKLFPQTRKLGLVFFMGIGDYVYAASALNDLKKAWPQLEFVGFVGSRSDNNNSPPVYDLLKADPNFSEVRRFEGSPDKDCWYNYDFESVYADKPDDMFILPMLYVHRRDVTCRDMTLRTTFGLPVPFVTPVPLVHEYPATPQVKALLERVLKLGRPVVYSQMSARSSDYHYSETDAVYLGLIERGYTVVTSETPGFEDEALVTIDVKALSICESIQLVRLIRDSELPIAVVSVISCFGAISAGLDIPNLVIQHFWDGNIASISFSNLHFITNRRYPDISNDRQYICSDAPRVPGRPDLHFYPSEFILKSFDHFARTAFKK